MIVTKVGAERGEDKSWKPALTRRGTRPRGRRTTCATSAWIRSTWSTSDDGRRTRTRRGVHRGAAQRARRTPGAGTDPPPGTQQRHPRQFAQGPRDRADRLRAESVQSRAAGGRRVDRRTCRARAWPTCRSSRWAGSRRCNPRRWRPWRNHSEATPMQVALAWLLQRSPNILLIPGTSSVGHLRENLAAAKLTLTPQMVTTLDGIAAKASE